MDMEDFLKLCDPIKYFESRRIIESAKLVLCAILSSMTVSTKGPSALGKVAILKFLLE